MRNNSFLLILLLLTAGCFFSTTVLGQSTKRTITGTVTNAEDGKALQGASVSLKGTNTVTTSDADGKFKIDASDKDVLVVTFSGFTLSEIKVGSATDVSVKLNREIKTVDEVVVVGYGTRKKSHLTGAIAQVGGKDIAAIQANRVDDALAGKLSGVLIQNQSGEPGADPKIQIRAASSLSGSSNPLIVVDGYPISGSLATVNPNDIESLEVLKDAASAAIYGSRGANGVILVSTKKGKAGKLSVNYNAFTSISRKYVKDIEMLYTASEWYTELNSNKYDLSEVNPTLRDYRLNAYRDAPDVVSMEDWLFRNGATNSHDLSIQGGNENIKVFASLGTLNTKGIVRTQAYERYNGRLNVDAKLSNKLKAGLSMNGYYGQQDIVPHDMRDLLRTYSISPIYHTAASIAFVQALNAQRATLSAGGLGTLANMNRTFDQDRRGIGLDPVSISLLKPGDVVHDWHYGRNQNGIGGTGDAGVAAKFDNAKLWQKTFFANTNAYLQYSILKGLDLKTVFGADIRDTRDYYYQGVLADGLQRSNESDLDIADLKRTTVLSETTLSYAKTFGKHDLSAVVGMEFQNTYFKGISSQGTNVPFGQPLNYALFSPADVITREIDETQSRRSVFGRVNYAYDDRYLASVSIRRDGDSRFGSNNKFQTFPAVSAGWNIHKESFFKSNLISQLKLRFSRGSLGTTSFLGSYDALSILSPSPTFLGTGFLIPQNVANPDLTWQSNTETNYGLSSGFLNNRFTFGVDYYTSDTKDMLINQSVSEVLGTPSVILNRGDVTSSGWEFELGATIINKADFRWNASANLSTVKTKITSLGDLQELPRVVYGGPAGRGPQFRNYVGGELGEMWGLEVVSEVESTFIQDPTQNIGFNSGVWYVVDQNKDGVINQADWVKLGTANPKFYWGLNTQLTYKNFDMSLQFQGSQGAKLYNIDPIYWKSQFADKTRTSFDLNNDGKADHNGLHYVQSRDAHGSMMQDASYLALRNMTIGYTLNPKWGSKVGISSARVYTAATNLFYKMAKNYTSYNPEGVETTNGGYQGPTTYGYQEGASPIVRSFTLGLNINF